MIRHWIFCVMRRASALAVVCALILAPVIIAATHGPGSPADIGLSAEALSHRHSHDIPDPGQSSVAHDATDHEHQTQMVLPQSSDSVFQFSAMRLGTSDLTANGVLASGLRRPPKTMSL